MQAITLQDIKEYFDSLDERDKKKFIEFLGYSVKTRWEPDGTKIKSVSDDRFVDDANAAYYKPKFAKEVMRIYDMLDITNKNHYVMVSSEKLRCSVQTLYLRLQQGLLYVVDKMDTPHKKYAELKESTILERVAGKGVRLRWRSVVDEQVVLTGSFEEDALIKEQNSAANRRKNQLAQTYENSWRGRIEKFLEEAPDGERLEIDGLNLNEDEMQFIRMSMVGIEGIRYSLTSRCIKMVKLDASTYETEFSGDL